MKEAIIHIENQKIINPKVMRQLIDSLKDGRYLVAIKSFKRRSLPQNAYYWAVLVPMIREGLHDQGWDEIQDDEDAHEFIKSQFLTRSVPNVNTGEMITVPGSTRKLTTVEFNELVARIQQWASEFLGIYIPGPNEPMPLNF